MLSDLSKEMVETFIKDRKNFLLMGWHRFDEVSESMKKYGYSGNIPHSRLEFKAKRYREYSLRNREGEKVRMMMVRMIDDAIMVIFP